MLPRQKAGHFFSQLTDDSSQLTVGTSMLVRFSAFSRQRFAGGEWWHGEALHYITTLPPTVSAPSLKKEGVKWLRY